MDKQEWTSARIAAEQPFVTLSSGAKMPVIGLGTYDAEEGDVKAVVKAAVLEHGYRHVDTARVYNNEERVGEALQECMQQGVRREDLFVVTKLWHDADKEDVEQALRRQLKALRLDYVDLYLVHWMLPAIDFTGADLVIGRTPSQRVWEQLERCVELGLVRSIGVSNCTIPMLLDLLTYCKIKPVVNQVELHPYLVQREFVAFQKRLGVEVTAYAPLGAFNWPFKREEHKHLNVLKEPLVSALAAKYGRPAG